MDRMRLAGRLRRSDPEGIEALTRPLHLSPTEAEISTFERLIDKALGKFDLIDTLRRSKPCASTPACGG